MIAATGIYLLACAVRSLEVLATGERLTWDPRPFYTFVVPSSIFAVAILLTSRRSSPGKGDAPEKVGHQ